MYYLIQGISLISFSFSLICVTLFFLNRKSASAKGYRYLATAIIAFLICIVSNLVPEIRVAYSLHDLKRQLEPNTQKSFAELYGPDWDHLWIISAHTNFGRKQIDACLGPQMASDDLLGLRPSNEKIYRIIFSRGGQVLKYIDLPKDAIVVDAQGEAKICLGAGTTAEIHRDKILIEEK